MFTRKYRTAKTNIGVAVSLGLEPTSTIPQGVISEKPKRSLSKPCHTPPTLSEVRLLYWQSGDATLKQSGWLGGPGLSL